MIPTILLVHTLDWPNAARLAIAFHEADCRVHALCQARHPVGRVTSLQRHYPLDLFSPLKSLRTAINAAAPDLVMPCDDAAVGHLHRLHREEEAKGPGSATAALIEHSLGNPAAYAQLATRSRLTEIAASADVHLPPTAIVRSFDELTAWGDEHGYPAVLKTDHSWGGEGVAIVKSRDQAQNVFAAMSRRPSLVRVMKRIVMNQDPNLWNRKFVDAPNTITIQKFVRGKVANAAVACWKGELLGALTVEVVQTLGPTGTGTIITPVQNIEMVETAQRVVRQSRMSGFCGFDFMIDGESGRACLIEINPRATQINHLVLGPGRDLPGILRARLAGEAPREAKAVTSAQTIALFPQAWKQDPQGKLLQKSYRDIPNQEPALVEALYRFSSAPRHAFMPPQPSYS